MFGLKMSQIKAITAISRKLQFDKKKLDVLLEGHKSGRDQDELLAELLGVPEGVPAKEYLQEKLTDKEYEVLREVVDNYTKGKGNNPLA